MFVKPRSYTLNGIVALCQIWPFPYLSLKVNSGITVKATLDLKIAIAGRLIG